MNEIPKSRIQTLSTEIEPRIKIAESHYSRAILKAATPEESDEIVYISEDSSVLKTKNGETIKTVHESIETPIGLILKIELNNGCIEYVDSALEVITLPNGETIKRIYKEKLELKKVWSMESSTQEHVTPWGILTTFTAKNDQNFLYDESGELVKFENNELIQTVDAPVTTHFGVMFRIKLKDKSYIIVEEDGKKFRAANGISLSRISNSEQTENGNFTNFTHATLIDGKNVYLDQNRNIITTKDGKRISKIFHDNQKVGNYSEDFTLVEIEGEHKALIDSSRKILTVKHEDASYYVTKLSILGYGTSFGNSRIINIGENKTDFIMKEDGTLLTTSDELVLYRPKSNFGDANHYDTCLGNIYEFRLWEDHSDVYLDAEKSIITTADGSVIHKVLASCKIDSTPRSFEERDEYIGLLANNSKTTFRGRFVQVKTSDEESIWINKKREVVAKDIVFNPGFVEITKLDGTREFIATRN